MRSEVYVSRFLRSFLPVMLVVLLLTGAGLFAQERGSSITGTVTDTSKGVLQGASVIATNNETKREFKATTGQDGKYYFRDVEPGRYSLNFEMTGFSKVEVTDVIPPAGQNINLRCCAADRQNWSR